MTSLDARTAPFELRAGPLLHGELVVASFTGREALSRLFRFDVRFVSAIDAATIEAQLLGQPAELSLDVPGCEPRRIRGIVARVRADGVRDERGRFRYQLRLVPRMWLLRKRKNTRIYQDATVIEVVDRVLDEHRIARQWRVARRYPRRAYCVQYEETDLDFVARQLAEDGLFFHFEQPADGGAPLDGERDERAERLIIGDNAEAYALIAGSLAEAAARGVERPPVVPFRPSDGMQAVEEHVIALGGRAALTPEVATQRDYDFERPLLDLTASTEEPPDEGPPADARERPARLEHYDHHGDDSNVDDAVDRADVRLEQLQRRATLAAGEGTCRRFSAGHRFLLEGHTDPQLDGDWALIEVTHEGVAPAFAVASGREAAPVYGGRFACVPAKRAYRPSPPKRKLVHAVESAVVVGPEREVIHTDAYGRIKVQFHWDREGRRDDRSSCWIRVAQTWSGSGWGFQFIPRVGMEVLVSFLGGDPDRPVVVGALYNRVNTPPFPLPFDKTRSGVRTSSTGGAGYNELSFEDASGKEQIRLRAERDLDEEIKRDHSRIVRGDASTMVAGSQRSEIGQRYDLSVHGGRSTLVGEDDLLTIAGRSTVRHGDAEIATLGSHRHHVGGASSTRVEGPMRVEAEGGLVTSVGGDHRLTVGVDGVENTSSTLVFGNMNLSATGNLTLRADAELTLTCGKTTLRLTPEKLEALTRTLHLLASEETFVVGGKPSLHLRDGAEIAAETVTLFSSGASLELTDAEARLGGSKVKLGKPTSASPKDEAAAPDPDTKKVRWRFTDAAHAPYAGKKYHLLVDGLRFEGQTDGDGALTAEIPKAAHGAEVILWIGDYPTGERRRYPIVIVDALPDAASAEGARARLHALGYDVGLQSADPWPAMRRAVHLFQTRHGEAFALEVTGELDDATKAAVERLFGS